MLVIGQGGAASGDTEREAARLEALAADLRRIGAGAAPNSADLAEAPLLEAWATIPWVGMCLVGTVTGHPLLRGPVIRTSDLWAFAPGLGWARTLSRFYRLGAPQPVRSSRSAQPEDQSDER